MIELKKEYPVEGRFNLIKHYAEDENGKIYYVKQVETGELYVEAIDLFPCKFTYIATNIPVDADDDDNGSENNESTDETNSSEQ